MAKDALNRDPAALDPATIAKLRADSRVGSDADLPVADRRSRARIVPGLNLAEGEIVTVVGDQKVLVLGPGRGRDTFLAGWQEETSPGVVVNCIGTYFENQIKTSR